MDDSDLAQFKQEVRDKAARRVRAKLGFAWHAALFLMANLTLAYINLSNNSNKLWFLWPLAVWGAALLEHARRAFLMQPPSAEMIEAEVQRELARRGIG
jgi:hypothetical protein